ncbi:Protein involved in iron metabolism in mitochondria [Komagataella phaffii]|uniref:Protein involved in iron metabolism in mitochondria n=2 Tax=Komagataella phaffii TaxID=460519 RepID=C4QXZ7_KOMPG|nr:Protein involved in iron metabolism in mitochondria [Komagataella phaffii GS115]AOA60903.1 GQ67_01892T0 [Komagataella phaffii]AOA65814.1 GQ68_01907T0 [Komagataella phaffii GS115]CAY68120.1 Protein involved in iron metabolism in mitochondria [Komagataella phaffii GS115]
MLRLLNRQKIVPINRTFLRSLFIQTQTTPNDDALKFLPSMKILPEQTTIEFLNGRQAFKSPLALKLFGIDGVKTIMIGHDFITVEKKTQDDWSLLKPEIFAVLTESLNNGTPVLNEQHQSDANDQALLEEDDEDEVVSMVKELIFTRIRPAIQDDGGDIEFVRFEYETGTVYLRLRGACRSCSSSSITLKNGIESMLKHYIEEVEAVEQIEEDEDGNEFEDPLAAKKPAQFEEAQLKPRSRDVAPPPSL